MPTTFSRVFYTAGQDRQLGVVNRHLPMLNTIATSASMFLNDVVQTRRKKSLMAWYMTIPELTAFATKVARDVVSKYHFEPINPTQSNRNRILTTNKFALKVQLRKVLKAQMLDMLVPGEAYGWLGKIPKAEVEKAVRKTISDRFMLDTKEMQDHLYTMFLKQTEGVSSVDGVDEDILKPRMYRYIPATTVEIKHDEFDIHSYVQTVGGRQVVFSPDEVVRYTLMEVDGRVSGFSSVQSVLVQLELLRFMWQNMLSVHKNGGAPDKIISLKNVQPGSPAYKRVEEQLSSYKKVENMHGNMLFTGEIQVEDLMALDQMQFKDMGLYITGLIAMQWGISRSAIPYIIGGTNTKSDVGGESDDSYWEVIRDMQLTFAETMNTQLWMPYFGVQLVFDNPHVMFNIREETARMNKFNNVMAMDRILMPAKKQLNTETRLYMLGIDEKMVEDMPEQDMMMQGQSVPGTGTPQQPTTKPKSPENQNVADSKRLEQTLAHRGAKPSGVSKETDSKFSQYPYAY